MSGHRRATNGSSDVLGKSATPSRSIGRIAIPCLSARMTRFVACRLSPVACRLSPVACRPSPAARRPSPVARFLEELAKMVAQALAVPATEPQPRSVSKDHGVLAAGIRSELADA